MDTPRSFADLFAAVRNGTAPPPHRVAELIVNALESRRNWLRDASRPDPRRDYDRECGYPKTGEIDPALYQDLYDRDGIANRVIHLWPRACFTVQPSIYEIEDPAIITPFERDWRMLGRQIKGEKSWYRDEEGSPVLAAFRDLDELSGIGRYGVMFLGLDDERPLYAPAAGFLEDGSVPQKPNDAPRDPEVWSPPRYSFAVNAKATEGRKLLFMRPLPESLAEATKYESNYRSPRFGLPVEYNLTLGDPNAGVSLAGPSARTFRTHWSRVVHVADNNGVPRLQPVLNNVLGLQKIHKADPEAFWLGALALWVFESHPDPAYAEVEFDKQSLRDEWEQLANGLQRVLATTGGQLRSLAPDVVDPTAHVTAQLQAICIQLDVAVRIFIGAEQGQLASGQDQKGHNKKVRSRQYSHVTPNVLAPVVDRLISVGVLSEPNYAGKEDDLVEQDQDGNPSSLHFAAGYSGWWPDLAHLSDKEVSEIAVSRTQAMVQYWQSELWRIIAPLDYFTAVIGFSEAEAQSYLENAEEYAKMRDKEDAEKKAKEPPPLPVNPPLPQDPEKNHITGREDAA